MRLEDQRHALDGGGIRAFAALGESGLHQRLRICQDGEAQASGALAAEIVLQALAIGGLGEHPGERVFPNAAGAGKKQRVRHTIPPEHPAEGAHDAFVAEK